MNRKQLEAALAKHGITVTNGKVKKTDIKAVLAAHTVTAGYTHYWSFAKGVKATSPAFKAAVADMKKIIKKHKNILEDQSTATIIDFNGIGDEGHENFVFDPREESNFCKTAQKPYDVAVVECLKAAKKRLGDKIELFSDGGKEIFAQTVTAADGIDTKGLLELIQEGNTKVDSSLQRDGVLVLKFQGANIIVSLHPDFKWGVMGDVSSLKTQASIFTEANLKSDDGNALDTMRDQYGTKAIVQHLIGDLSSLAKVYEGNPQHGDSDNQDLQQWLKDAAADVAVLRAALAALKT